MLWSRLDFYHTERLRISCDDIQTDIRNALQIGQARTEESNTNQPHQGHNNMIYRGQIPCVWYYFLAATDKEDWGKLIALYIHMNLNG